jgi:polyhydroxyalkanoate synthesis regulator phasin
MIIKTARKNQGEGHPLLFFLKCKKFILEELKMDLLKNVFSLGLGAAAATKDQIEKAVDSLVKKGEISKEDSKDLIKNWVEKGEQAQKQLDDSVKAKVNQALNSLNLATKEEVQDLERRIQILEKQNQQS